MRNIKVALYEQKDPMDVMMGIDKTYHGLALVNDEGDSSFDILTINLPSRLGDFCEFIGMEDAAYMDINNYPWVDELIKEGVAVDTGYTKQSGFVSYPLYKFDKNWLRSLPAWDDKYTYDMYLASYNEVMSEAG